ncbi:PKD domain-containing protein [Methanochimaera problematica]|nr:PKD domain-containing protein [Methanoplanus sp. FWC-SCC4]
MFSDLRKTSAVLLLFILIMVPVSAEYVVPCDYVGEIGIKTTEASGFYGIAIDGSDNLYVPVQDGTDEPNSTIEIFSSSGVKTGSWFAPDSNGPQDICFNSSGFAYVGYYNSNNSINIYKPDGVLVRSEKKDDNIPWEKVGHLATDSDDMLYLSDLTHKGRDMDIYDLGFNKLKTISSTEGYFRKMAFNSSDYMFLASVDDSFISGKVNVYEPDRDFLTSFGDEGNIGSPMSVAIDDQDGIFVSDGNDYLIKYFNSDFGFVKSFGGSGTNSGQFNINSGPKGMALNSTGYLYVSDTYSKRVQIFGALLPEVNSLSVVEAKTGRNVDIIVTGGNFSTGYEGTGTDIRYVNLTKGDLVVAGDNPVVHDSGSLSVSFNLAGVTPGYYNMTVANPSGLTGFVENAFLVTPENPVSVSFTADKSVVYAPDTIHFESTSTGDISEYNWTVGGVFASNSSSFDKTFDTAGIYSVNLNVTDIWGYESNTSSDITVYPVSSFTADNTTGEGPLFVSFNETSTGRPDNYEWSIDGVFESNERNITHTFDPGRYLVSLNVSFGGLYNRSDIEIVSNPPVPVNASFYAGKNEGVLNDVISFNDTSEGDTLSYEWLIDNVHASDSQNMTYTFADSGVFDIRLNVTDRWGFSDNTSASVKIYPLPKFTANITEFHAPCSIRFTDTSIQAFDKREWFINGVMVSSELDFIRDFETAGNYTVTLRQSSDGINNETSTVVKIFLRANASFTENSLTGGAPFRFTAVDTSSGYITSRNWTVDEFLNISSSPVLVHNFDTAGNHTVGINVTDKWGNTDNITKTVSVFPVAEFSMDKSEGCAPLTVAFASTSTGNPVLFNWTVNGTPESNAVSFSRTFEKPGVYPVVLNVSAGGLSGEVSHNVTVTKKPVTPTETPRSGQGSGGNSNVGSGYATQISSGSTASFKMSKGAVYDVEVTAARDVPKLMVTVEEVSGINSNMAIEDTPVYEYEKATLYKTSSDSMKDADLFFKVEKKWLSGKGYKQGDVVMKHYVNGGWESLPTYFVREDAGFYYYKAITPSFSYFAITVEKNATIFEDDGKISGLPETDLISGINNIQTENGTNTDSAGTKKAGTGPVWLFVCIISGIIAISLNKRSGK